MTKLQKYRTLVDETEMLKCRMTQLKQDLEEIEMLYFCTPDKNLARLYKKAKKQYDAIKKQVMKNQQKLKIFNWR